MERNHLLKGDIANSVELRIKTPSAELQNGVGSTFLGSVWTQTEQNIENTALFNESAMDDKTN